MNELAVHPNVYATGRNRGLVPLLERVRLREQEPGEGTLYVLSGFANYNGGVRFFPVFHRHVESGGKVVALFAGSTGRNITSRQVVQGMLECGAEVGIVNRKRLMHVKSYGSRTRDGDMVVVSSGNFTGPGMAQNVEMSILLDRPTARGIGFSWVDLVSSILSQSWQLHRPELDDTSSPAWRLLYDEQASGIVLDETNEVTLIVILGHADTVRINATPGTIKARGTQYFWLSRDCYDFFPALTIPNTQGVKKTYGRRHARTLIRITTIRPHAERDRSTTVQIARETTPAPVEIGYRLDRRVRGIRPGMHPGAEGGDGLEPLSHVPLLDGRDPRRLDLPASLRDPLRRLLARRYRQRASVRVYVIADLSASLGFRGRGDRLETLAAFTSALGYSAGRAGDAFAFIGCDESVREEFVLPPTRAPGAFLDLAARLRAFTPGGRGAAGLLEALPMIGGRRSLVFLLSDFHFPLTLLDGLLAGLARHRIVPVVLADRGESDPAPGFGIARVSDPETGEERTLWMRPALRRRLREQAERRREALAGCFAAHGVEPLRLTDHFEADRVNAWFRG